MMSSKSASGSARGRRRSELEPRTASDTHKVFFLQDVFHYWSLTTARGRSGLGVRSHVRGCQKAGEGVPRGVTASAPAVPCPKPRRRET